ncbi:MAG: hypothetical protein A2Y10_06335 [Planctomycetes bacterium GWF2_41_51]|nr:MAG: hypothetical protein A2Y10_06335 [Planctomycetes bacterium GWF2_41_51]
MIKKSAFFVCLLSLFFVIGCQQGQKPPKTVTEQLKDSTIATSGYDTYLSAYFSPDDYFIARDPSGGRDLYLTVVDKNGKPMECCKKPMKMKLDKDGKAFLKCPHCGKLNPIAVKDGTVVVE